MRLGLMLVAACLRAAAPAGTDQAQDSSRASDRAHIAWVAASLKQMQTVHPGMTRAELLHVFTSEGGLSTRSARTYAFQGCPYFKVDVQFRPVDDTHTESPADVIMPISKPYLEWGVVD